MDGGELTELQRKIIDLASEYETEIKINTIAEKLLPYTKIEVSNAASELFDLVFFNILYF